MNEIEHKLIKAYKEYIDFLTKEYVEVFMIANAHGIIVVMKVFYLVSN